MTAVRPTLRDATWLYRIKQDNRAQDGEDRVAALEARPEVLAVGSVTLDASPATTTTVTVSGLLATDFVMLTPTTAAAALEGLVHVTPGAGSFDITHSDGPSGRTYAYLAVRA